MLTSFVPCGMPRTQWCTYFSSLRLIVNVYAQYKLERTIQDARHSAAEDRDGNLGEQICSMREEIETLAFSTLGG